MKRDFCVIVTVKNEATMLPLWFEYYLKHVEPCDIYVEDDSSTDDCMSFVPKGVHISTVPQQRSCVPNNLLIHVTDRIAELLRSYECVLFAEADELMIAHDNDLRGFVRSLIASSAEYHVVYNVDVIHNVNCEPPVDINMRPLLRQRQHYVHIPKYNKAVFWKVRPRWSGNIHTVDGLRTAVQNQQLYYVHLHEFDFDMCNARHKSRNVGANHNFANLYNANVDDQLRDWFIRKFNNPASLYTGASINLIPESLKDSF
jgi:hypothetical protein